MTPEEALRSGDLQAALAGAQAAVRSAPADARVRAALAEVLMARGEWERCLTQLGVMSELDALTLPTAHLYRSAIQTEPVRTAVFAGRRSPLIFGEPPSWIAMLVQALAHDGQGEYAGASDLRAQALEAAPAVAGRINGEPFEWLADADSRLGPVLEAVINGAYYWVPFERIKQARIHEPEDLRDLVWLTVDFTWANEGQVSGLIPVRYPGTESATDDRLRLARLTEWAEAEGRSAVGLGQRVWVTEANEYPLLDVRELEFGGAA
jgi:type VI secretion system protein ImpE